MKEELEQRIDALEAVRENIANVPTVLDIYKKYLTIAKEDVEIKGKTLERANVEQASLLSYYDERRIELRAVVRYFEIKLESKRGEKWRNYTENYPRDLQSKDKEYYVNHNEDYIALAEVLVEVKMVYEQFERVVEALKARGYALNNLTRLKVAQISDVII